MPGPAELTMVLTTALGDALFFQSMSAQEEVSRLFEFEIMALSDDAAISADDLLGTEVKVSMEVGDDAKRWFHGIVSGFGIDGSWGRYHRYRLTVRPWLWLLTRSSDVRIFQDKTALDIVKEVFGEHTSNFADETSGSYTTRPYCVQYRETDFNFVSRLLEEEGIFYFFRHSDGGHVLVLADEPGALEPVAGFTEARYVQNPQAAGEVESITAWRMTHEIQPGKSVLRDFNFETPSTDLTTTEAAAARSHAEAEEELYDYPGLYAVKADGDARNQIRLDEWQGRFARFGGEGNVAWIASGYKLTLVEHPRDDQNAEYIVLRTHIDMELAGYESASGPEADIETKFLCRFLAQPSAEPLRPARITRKPSVAGPQTAIVVGDADPGDILTDEFGRVKLQFHWDRLGQKNAQSSCWVRVASPAAGNGWGMISLPRIGQEVVVDFLEGDPDRPLITGRVYNAEQKVPYELPANATVSTLKSRSKLGAAAEFNELRFEDKAGNEYILLHAQKDRLDFVEGTLKSQIGIGDGVGDEHRTVKNDRKEKIDGEHHLQVAKDVKVKYGQKYNLQVVDAIQAKTDSKFNLKAGEDILAESGTTIGLKAGTEMHIKVGQNLGVDAGMNVHIKGGMNVVIEAGTQLTLKGGSGSVVLDMGGVSITGPMVKINSGGSPGSGNGASPTAPTAPDAPADPEVPEDPLSHR